ncbi:hypothetical protein BST12_27775 [Mycobacterium angelicum]|uniref:Uncharacterized protein n=1 Tax=Mycobacterium angelicum TaxID=470074 RepID=A0A1W9Z9M5_MYCAN|nr:hypothetical protein BST12_27775 [Mycobacterium angelicum]
MNQPAATGDHRQTDYLLRVLGQICRRTNRTIDQYLRAKALTEAVGHSDYACGLRRPTGINERDRRTLERLIDCLQRRFPPDGWDEVPPISRRARPGVR